MGRLRAGCGLRHYRHEELALAGESDIGDYLAKQREAARETEVVLWERFRHRVTMAGDTLHYVAVAARKLIPRRQWMAGECLSGSAGTRYAGVVNLDRREGSPRLTA
jgi:hypothetical protein